jgi:arylsulfatase
LHSTPAWYIRECGAFFLLGTAAVQAFAATFKDFPLFQKPKTFTIDDAIGKMAEATRHGSRCRSHPRSLN